MTSSRRPSAWRTRAWTRDRDRALSVVPAKVGPHTAGAICGTRWPTFFAKHLPGVMGPGFRRDDIVEMFRSNSHAALRHCEERSDEAIKGRAHEFGIAAVAPLLPMTAVSVTRPWPDALERALDRVAIVRSFVAGSEPVPSAIRQPASAWHQPYSFPSWLPRICRLGSHRNPRAPSTHRP